MLNLVKIAVTGQPGSGKSTICRLLEEQGAYVVSADDIVHQLLSSQPKIIKEVVELLGEKVIVAGRLDRKAMATIVFNDHRLLQKLEKILHPAVLQEIEDCYQRVLEKGVHSLFVAEVPLLYEAHFENVFDKVILVVTQDTTCIQRLLKTGTITPEEYMQRKERFISNKEKRADFIIKNDGTLNELKQNIATIYANLSTNQKT